MLRLRSAVLFAALAAVLPAQSADADLQAAHAGYQEKHKALTEAMLQARQSGELKKGGVPSPALQELQAAADAVRAALLRDFGSRNDLSAASWLLLARVHEQDRDYRAAVDAYARSLQQGDPQAPDLQTMGSLCIAAMNSKDEALAADWMQKTIAAEDAQGSARRNPSVRTSYYPRTLIALGAWDRLQAHLEALARDPAPACRTAAVTFGVVAAIHRGELAVAQAQIDAIRRDPATYPDHQAWAVLVQLALCTHRGEFDQGAALVREFLAAPPPEGATGSAVDRNQRRYVAAAAPFLGKPAPAVRFDHWVGGRVEGDDTLAALRGKVVVLDFWQPWCEPCRKAMPHLVALQKAHPDDLQVIGPCKVEDYGYDVSERAAVRPIAPEDYPAHVQDFHQDMQLNYPLGIAGSGVNSQAYGVTGIPTLVVIDRQGVVRYLSCGAGEPGLLELAVTGVLRAK